MDFISYCIYLIYFISLFIYYTFCFIFRKQFPILPSISVSVLTWFFVSFLFYIENPHDISAESVLSTVQSIMPFFCNLAFIRFWIIHFCCTFFLFLLGCKKGKKTRHITSLDRNSDLPSKYPLKIPSPSFLWHFHFLCLLKMFYLFAVQL